VSLVNEWTCLMESIRDEMTKFIPGAIRNDATVK